MNQAWFHRRLKRKRQHNKSNKQCIVDALWLTELFVARGGLVGLSKLGIRAFEANSKSELKAKGLNHTTKSNFAESNLTKSSLVKSSPAKSSYQVFECVALVPILRRRSSAESAVSNFDNLLDRSVWLLRRPFKLWTRCLAVGPFRLGSLERCRLQTLNSWIPCSLSTFTFHIHRLRFTVVHSTVMVCH